MNKLVLLFTLFILNYNMVYSQSIMLVKNDNGKGHNKQVTIPTPPAEPKYRLVDVPLVNYFLISQNDWQALSNYFDQFEAYATAADNELMKIKKLKNPKKRPNAPRLNLSNVAATDLPPILRSSRDTYLAINKNDRQTLDQQLQEIKTYINETQALFKS